MMTNCELCGREFFDELTGAACPSDDCPSKNLIKIDTVSELDAHGLIVKPEHLPEAKAAIEYWLRNEIRQFIREMLQQKHVEFEEEQI